MRVLFTSLRTPSHFFPLVPFLDACRRQGHEVAVAAPEDLADRVAKTGAKLFPFEHPGDAGLRPLWDRASKGEPEVVISEVFAGECARFSLPGLLTAVDAFRPGVIVRESQEYSAVIAAEKKGIPHVRVSITSPRKEHEIFALAAASVDKHRAGLGLSPERAGADRLAKEPALTLFPASLGGDSQGEGPLYRFRSPRPTPPALPSWWAGQTGPFVYVTFGTVLGSIAKMRGGPYRAAVEAMKDLPVRVLFTIGAEQPLEDLGPIPANVHVERFVPQDDVLQHAAAVVCHGGSGTVLGALAAGIPMVVAPLFADQPTNAQKVDSMGAGIGLPVGSPSPESLRSALVKVLEHEPYRAAAQKVAAEIAALPLVDEVAKTLERLASTSR
jgi:hypothetical protein